MPERKPHDILRQASDAADRAERESELRSVMEMGQEVAIYFRTLRVNGMDLSESVLLAQHFAAIRCGVFDDGEE